MTLCLDKHSISVSLNLRLKAVEKSCCSFDSIELHHCLLHFKAKTKTHALSTVIEEMSIFV